MIDLSSHLGMKVNLSAVSSALSYNKVYCSLVVLDPFSIDGWPKVTLDGISLSALLYNYLVFKGFSFCIGKTVIFGLSGVVKLLDIFAYKSVWVYPYFHIGYIHICI